LGPLRQIPRTPVHQVFTHRARVCVQALVLNPGLSGGRVLARACDIFHAATGESATTFVHRACEPGNGHALLPVVGFRRKLLTRSRHTGTGGATPSAGWAQPGTTLPGEPSTSLSTAASTATGSCT